MNLHVVLVRTENHNNIGTAVRAMANMGVRRLILIDPRCAVDPHALEAAAGAREGYTDLVVYTSWKEFYDHEGEGLRLAFTRRCGKRRRPRALDEVLGELGEENKNVYLIFGPEADGLDADDLAFVNFAVHLPVFGEFGSFNLAQAVLLALFMFRRHFPPRLMPEQLKGETAEAVQPLYIPDGLIRRWLTAMGFDIQARRSSAYLTLRRLFLQNRPTRHEMQVLEAILQQNVRKLEEQSELLGLTLKDVADDLGEIPR
jgi:tRNA/rRNA methyltransferase